MTRPFSKLSAQQKALLKQFGQQNPVSQGAATISQRSETEPLILSSAQEWMWLLERLAAPAYNTPLVLRLLGQLDHKTLLRALTDLVHRHEILRTTIDASTTTLRPIIHEPGEITLHTIDVSEYPVTERSAAALKVIDQSLTERFQLTQDFPYRLNLICLTPTEHWLHLTLHHSASDDTTFAIFLKELTALYAAYRQGCPSPLQPLPLQYADYALWQQQQLKLNQDQQLNYWRQQLQDSQPRLNLPGCTPTTGVSGPCAHTTFAFSVDLTDKVKRFSRQNQVTLFTTLLATFEILLYRYTQQSDVLVGVPVSLRTHPSLQTLIGVFMNILPIRLDLADAPTSQTVLQRLQAIMIAAQTHQDVPFHQIVAALRAEQAHWDAGLSVIFDFQSRSLPETHVNGLTFAPKDHHPPSPAALLTLHMEEKANQLHGTFLFNPQQWDCQIIEAMGHHFQVLLRGMMATPTVPLTHLPLLTAAERHQLLVEWNNPQIDVPQGLCIHQQFEAQAARTPDAIAVIDDHQQLTYAQLNQRANQLAHYLRSTHGLPSVDMQSDDGTRTNGLVGLCVERSIEMVVGILGILKAGGAYVPLDPSYPQQRLQLILADADIPVILTQRQLLDRLPNHHAQIICLDRDGAAIAQASPNNLDHDGAADQLAYVIYTSGSTGRPKGVLIPHQNVVRLFSVTQPLYSFGAQDCWTLFHSYAFDFSVWEIWGALLHGGRLIIVSYWVSRSPQAFYDLLVHHQVTVLNQTPSAFSQLIQIDPAYPVDALGLRYIILGGEALQLEPLRPWFTRHGDQSPQLVNMYGITETTVHVTHQLLSATDLTSTGSLIGRPLADLQVYILDPHQQLVPLGISGELYISGAGLAQGYLNGPEQTAEKFIANPFGDGLLYRTGDRVRYNASGSLEYLGRLDAQVNIRGFRIELGEIETVLAQLPEIEGALVVAREDHFQDQKLIAYLIPAPHANTDSAALRATLQTKLPNYMVPNAFVFLEQFPLTPNGKVDGKALPAPESQRTLTHITAPITPTEQQLVAIWQTVLHLDTVGTTENFFELGGHSLLATQVMVRIRQTLNIERPLRDLFTWPTIAELAAHIDHSTHSEALPPITVVDRSTEPPLSFAQQRLWFIDQLEGANAVYNIPLLLDLRGPLKVEALTRSLRTVIDRHEILRTQIMVDGGNPVLQCRATADWSLEQVDLAARSHPDREADRTRYIQTAAETPFDLNQDWLVRGYLLRLAPTHHQLLITLHHIVGDGWSLSILQRELTHLYQAFSQGQDSPLAPLAIQYWDYAVWQHQLWHQQHLAAQVDDWTQTLAGIPTLLALPTDRPRPALQSFRGQQDIFMLAPDLTADLKEWSQAHGVTLFMALLAALQILLFRYSGQSDIVVGSPIANRRRAELEPLMGFFANTLALRTQFTDGLTVEALLAQVKETCLDAYAHQDIPFEQVVEALQPERSLSHSPIFQVMLVLQNTPQAPLISTALTWTQLPVSSNTAKFDLTLFFEDSPSGLQGRWEYNTDLFDRATIQRATGHFQVLLAAMIADTTQPIATLPLLTAAEDQQLRVAWNNTTQAYPDTCCLHEVFEAQVEKTPDAIALIHQDQAISYATLNQRANHLAEALRALGVQSDTPVGICLTRSPHMAIAVLAILKAGGAYVPLDPSYPPKRLAHMLSDSQAQWVLTATPLIPLLPGGGPTCICLDQPLPSRTTTPPPPSALSPDHLAYIIYTSGSTGHPKGVAMPHRPLVNLIHWQCHQLSQPGRTLQYTPLSFDVSCQELFATWGTGGTLVLISDADRRDFQALHHCLHQQQINYLFLPFVALQGLAEATGNQPFPPHLQDVFTAGEALHISPAIAAFFRQGPDCRLHNQYGPTETHVATAHTLSGAPHLWPAWPPIGRPIANARIYLLSPAGEPVPIGIPGEIYIGGVAIARGYYRQPEQTQARFVTAPGAVGHQRQRLYRTGDLGRYRADGTLEFWGRCDQQVKLRGFRIEPGEIEAILLNHPAVYQCAVVVGKHVHHSQLVAYLVTPQAYGEIQAELWQSLQRTLPSYMLPNRLVPIDALPLTPTGKVDRQSLSVLASQPITATISKGRPRKLLEQTLVHIWEEYLEIQPIGIQDNFFALGGHSLLAVKVLAAMERHTGVSLPLNQLFQTPTIEAITNTLEHQTTALPPCLVLMKPGTGHPPLFLIHAAGSSVLFYQPLAQHLRTDRPIYAIQSVFLSNPNAQIESVAALAQYYLQRIKQIQPHGPYYIGGASFGGILAYEIAQLLWQEAAEIGAIILFDRAAPGGRWPLTEKGRIQELPIQKRYQLYWQNFLGSGLPYLLTKVKKRAIFDWQRLPKLAEAHKHNNLLRRRLGFPVKALSNGEVYALHLQLNAAYIPQPYPGEIIVIRAEEFPQNHAYAADLGWSRYAQGGVTVWMNPGGHMSMFSGTNAESLAKQLDTILP